MTKSSASPMIKLVGFYVSWTEYERGWGCRPDGYFFYKDAETAKNETRERLAKLREEENKQFKGEVPYEYSSPDNPLEPKMAFITPEMAKEIEETGIAYRIMPPYNEQGALSKYYPRNYPKETF